MRIETTYCPVLGTAVTRVIDFEGSIERVICPEYLGGGTCRVKQAAARNAPLSRLLERVHDGTIAEHTTACSLR